MITILTKKDLIEYAKNKPIFDIGKYDFNWHNISNELINTSDVYIYVEKNLIKIIKARYTMEGSIKPKIELMKWIN